jgi:hypothetical protein
MKERKQLYKCKKPCPLRELDKLYCCMKSYPNNHTEIEKIKQQIKEVEIDSGNI